MNYVTNILMKFFFNYNYLLNFQYNYNFTALIFSFIFVIYHTNRTDNHNFLLNFCEYIFDVNVFIYFKINIEKKIAYTYIILIKLYI